MRKNIIITLACMWLRLNFGFTQVITGDTFFYPAEIVDGNYNKDKIAIQNPVSINQESFTPGVVAVPGIPMTAIAKDDSAHIVKSRFWNSNPHSTRYFWAPNGYGLERGEGYYQNTWVFYNQVTVAPSKYFSLGVGVIPLFLIYGAPTPVWLAPKVSIPVVEDQFNVGAGVFAGWILGRELNLGGLGIAYGTATLGSRDKNASIGMGYGYFDGQWASSPTISLSGMVRTGEKLAIISENYLLGGDEKVVLLSFGIRYLGTNLAIDGALIVPLVADSLLALPWLSVHVPFQIGR